jgi:hypothetical protein
MPWDDIDADTDDDGILEGIECRGCANFDGDATPDANETDSDGDGILDTKEDKNKNGRWDAGMPARARELNGGSRLKASFHGIQIEGRTASADAFARRPRGKATSPVDSRC